jgi:hypothetical protein
MEHGVAEVIRPSVLNALIIFASVIVVGFIWRMGSAYFSDNAAGEAGAVIY